MGSNSKIEVMRVRAGMRKTFYPKACDALGDVGGITSLQRAKFVKALYEADHTYKSIAQHCHRSWGGTWSPANHPMMGLYLVEAAQKRMNERFEG